METKKERVARMKVFAYQTLPLQLAASVVKYDRGGFCVPLVRGEEDKGNRTDECAAGGPPLVGSDFEVFSNPSLTSAWR
jgi:hypothetical protein